MLVFVDWLYFDVGRQVVLASAGCRLVLEDPQLGAEFTDLQPDKVAAVR